MRSVPSAREPRRLPSWALAEGPFGIRLVDLVITLLVILAMEINVTVGSGPGAVPLTLTAHLLGAVLAVPILFRHRYPFQVMLATAVLIFLYYIFARRDISPAPLFAVPFYDAAVAGYLAWAAVIGGSFMVTGLFVVELSTREGLARLASDFLPQIAVLALGLALGETVRSRRALAAETTTRLRLAEEERAAEAGRLVAEERLRIARELHDTVAHSMATITVQAGSALHLLTGGPPVRPNDVSPGLRAPQGGPVADVDMLRAALTAIRETSKGALIDMRTVLGQLRRSDLQDPETGPAAARTGLDRLADLRDAVTAAGANVTVTVEGEQGPLPPQIDHSAYRILQESLTNVLRHAGPGAAAQVCLRYQPEVLVITVTNEGCADGGPAPAGNGAGGHGIAGMRERATSVGGELTAGPLSGGGFQVRATLPTSAPVAVPAARGESS